MKQRYNTIYLQNTSSVNKMLTMLVPIIYTMICVLLTALQRVSCFFLGLNEVPKIGTNGN